MLTNILMLKLMGTLFTRVLRLIFDSSVIFKPCQDFSVKTALIFCTNLFILPTKDEKEKVGV